MMCNTSNSVGRVPTAASHTTFVVRVSALRFVLSLCFRVCHVILMLPGQLIGYTVSAKQSSFFFFSFFLGYSSSPLSPSLPRSLAPPLSLFLPRSLSLSTVHVCLLLRQRTFHCRLVQGQCHGRRQVQHGWSGHAHRRLLRMVHRR